MEATKKILIGGQKLKELGSSRNTLDFDYLIYNENMPLFSHENGIDYINAAKSSFFRAIYNNEVDGDNITLRGLFELKAYAWVQHILNGRFDKAEDCRYDMAFLLRKGVKPTFTYLNGAISLAEMNELKKELAGIKIK